MKIIPQGYPCLIALAFLFNVSPVFANDESTRPSKPNFLLILADDLGWQDIKVYDTVAPYSVFETPHMDQLAAEGIRFTNGYSPTPVCAPSRVAIMTGKHPGRTDVTSVSGGKCPKASGSNASYITPHYRSSLKDEEYSLAEALQDQGYFTGVFGKWHMSPDGHHFTFPLPTDQGFDRAYNGRGVQSGMSNRLTGFATTDPSDPYQLDGNGMAKDPVTEETLDFFADAVSQEEPFFCYYSTWLVHGPWQMRTESLLVKYANLMGYSYPLDGSEVFAEGQKNPYYGAMVESLDYYIDQILTYLENTDDPRWPGHKLIENTYVVLTSDNGGMETGDPDGYVTDNYPLDKGKIWIKEGGTRVPFIISGPGITANSVSDVVINGMDLFPTFLSLAGETTLPEYLEGCDLSDLLLNDPQDNARVLDASGDVRESMFWHFPHSGRVATTLLKDGWKLYKNYDYLTNNLAAQAYSLYQLYDSNGNPVDLGEMTDLIDSQTVVADAMISEIEAWINEVDARPLYFNPKRTSLLLADQNPSILSTGHDDTVAWVAWDTNLAKVKYLDLLYTKNASGANTEEWFKVPVPFTHSRGWAEVAIPDGAESFFFTLVDENRFFVSSVDLTGHSGYDSERVPLYTWLPENEATLSDAGVNFPSSDVLFSNSINESEVALRNNAESPVILSDTFSANTLTKDGSLYQNSTGWRAISSTSWHVGTGNGWVYNVNVNDGAKSDGALAQIIDLSNKGLTVENQLKVEFNFVSWDGANDSDNIYVHLWGLVDDSANGSSFVGNLSAENGNMWADAVENGFSVYNLGDGSQMTAIQGGASGNAAIKLLDQDSGSSLIRDAINVSVTFDLSSYAVDTLAGYDYIVIGFARDPQAGGNKFALYDVALTGLAESSTSLVGQTFSVTEPVNLRALTLQASSDYTAASNSSAELYLWIGDYESGAPGSELLRTRVYDKIDMGGVTMTADNYYTIDFEDSVFLPGTYAFHLKWKEGEAANYLSWGRANGAGEYADGDLIHFQTSSSGTTDFPFSQIESVGSDLVFALHGSVDYYGGWVVENALDRTPEVVYLESLHDVLTKGVQSYSKANVSAWTVTQNGLTNASSNNSAVGEAAVGRFIDLTALEASDAAQLTLRFDYTTADPNEVLYVHLWGCVDLDPSQNIQLMNLGAQNGNAWVNESAGIMDVYNLGKPDGAFSGSRGSGSDAAAILTGSTGPQTFSKSFDLSLFTTAPDTISEYDYLVLGFAREVGSSTSASVSIRNIEVSIHGGSMLHQSMNSSISFRDNKNSDPDADGYVNLLEYALGGDPNDRNDVGVLPKIQNSASGIDFIYNRRRNAANLGINYSIETTSTLQIPSWGSGDMVETDVTIIDADFEAVTNRVSTTGKTSEFMRLAVED